jgi:hypothetical protein
MPESMRVMMTLWYVGIWPSSSTGITSGSIPPVSWPLSEASSPTIATSTRPARSEATVAA